MASWLFSVVGFAMSDSLLTLANPFAMVLWIVAALVFFAVWFFVNRISVKANQQVYLLQEILEQQRRQTELMKRIAAQSGVDDSATTSSKDLHGDTPELSIGGFIAER
jgi:hypothetical protein